MIYGESVVLFWTKARTEKLKVLWNDHVVARKIGEAIGCSRAAVIGKAHRMRLESRAGNMKRPQKAKPEMRLEPAKLPVIKDDLYPLIPSLLELEACHCKFPMQSGYCGRARAKDKIYCEYHHGITHVPTAPMRKAK